MISAVAAGCGWVGYSVGFRDAKRQLLASLRPCRRHGTDGMAPVDWSRAGWLARRHPYHRDGDDREALSNRARLRGPWQHAREARTARLDVASAPAPCRDARACGGLLW